MKALSAAVLAERELDSYEDEKNGTAHIENDSQVNRHWWNFTKAITIVDSDTIVA